MRNKTEPAQPPFSPEISIHNRISLPTSLQLGMEKKKQKEQKKDIVPRG
jgi:hypothetical protein